MTPSYNPLKFLLASVVGAIPGLLVYRRLLKTEALGRKRMLVAAVAIGVVTAVSSTIVYLLSGATAAFAGADEHAVGVASFFGVCVGICAVLFRDGTTFIFRKRKPRQRVSVIGTFHDDDGLTNASELLAILERIRPEVIFLEVPAARFDEYFNGPDRSPESRAVSRYQLTHPVDLVPVDLPTPTAEFFENNKELFKAIERISPDYCGLVDGHRRYRRAHGFAYLNSDEADKSWSEQEEAELSAVKKLANDRYMALYQLWRSTHERRELAWVMAIGDYCAQHTFENGVLLVGAAHRRSIQDKARKGSASGASAIEWDFSGLLRAPVNGAVR